MNVPYFVPWITDQDKKFVLNSLNNRWLTNGPFLKKFEDKFSKFIKSKHASGVGSATQALHLSMRSLDVNSEDEVIVPTLTFAATANAVRYCNANPILADVDPETFNILPKEIEKKISKKTKGIIAVHYGGQSCQMDEILSIAKKHNLFVVEDCAHSLGSTFKKLCCGSIGSTGCFSFYPTKVITTGEGGMVTTNNLKLYKKIETLKNQGMSILPAQREKLSKWKYDVVDVGYNYRLDEIRSSLGLSQMNRIDIINKKRIKIAEYYNNFLSKIKGISIPKTKKDRNHIYHLYTIKIENDFHLTRDQVFNKLSEKGIGTSVQYWPLHLMSYNKKRYKKNEFKNANFLKDQLISLPIYPLMTEKQIKYVAQTLLTI
jgi:perosamine synthetase